MSLPEITVVIGIDFKTVQQLEVSHRTWKLHHPEMWNWPWLVFFDGCCDHFSRHFFADVVARGILPGHARCVPWPQCVGGNSRTPKYESQRERMLSGHVWVPALHVETEYYLKLDTDALAHRAGEWPKEEWFYGEPITTHSPSGTVSTTSSGESPVVVAPGWGYTKGIDFLKRLDDWGDSCKSMYGTSRLNIPSNPGQLRVGHPRWCSWNSFYQTEWAKLTVEMLRETMHNGTLPVPSQDTFAWFCAERCGKFVRKVNMKKSGWNNYPKLDNLILTAQQIMSGANLDSAVDS